LLEREQELARVSELVDATAAGEFRLAVVEGPAGAGKSAILGALAGCAAERGVRALRATGLELEREYPFGVVRQLFEPAVYGLEPAARAEVFAGAAGLAEGLFASPEVGSGPGVADPGFALLHSLYWVLVGLTDLGPVAVVVDDVQWADELSLRFLAFALKRSEELSLLLACARRLVPAGEEPDALAAVLSGPASVIQPAPLSGEAIGLLLARAGGRELGEDVIAEAERLTEGNPLYVRELADSLASADLSAADDPFAVLRSAAPAAVGRRVHTALARLDRASQAVAKATAILGDEVQMQRAAILADIDGESASNAADALARAGILSVGDPLRFRHPLVREAVLESIEPRARARAHGRAGRLLIAAGEPPERAAVHLLESDPAGDPEVVSALRAAAQRAAAGAAPKLAIRALKRALREPPEPSERPLILKDLGLAESLDGNWDSIEHFQEAFATAGPLDQMTDGAVRYMMVLMARGGSAEAEAVIDRVVEAIGDREQQLTLEAELCTLALAYTIPGAHERLARATASLRGETPAERLLLGLRAYDAVNSGVMTAPEAALAVGDALGDGSLLARLGPDSPTYLGMIKALMEFDANDLVEPEVSRAIAEARRRGAGVGLTIATSSRGSIAHKRGELVSAEPDFRTAVEIAAQMGWLRAYPITLPALVDVLTDTGEFGEADRVLEANDFSGQLPQGEAFTGLLGARGRLRLAQGRSEQGIADLEAQRARLDEATHPPPFFRASVARSLVPALMQAGRGQEAREIADDALRAARAYGAPRYIADSLRSSGLAHAGGPDIDQLREAVSIYERIGAQVGVARTLVDIGATLRRQRKAAAAREPLRRALDIARACGARPLAERAEHELRAAGARPRRDRITGRDALTASERRVAQLAVEGMTNRQIAETLFITRKTVESHLDHVFRKLGIHARGELEQGLAAEDELNRVG
jgi:DNA-binding CsgD family transcriptional regulator